MNSDALVIFNLVKSRITLTYPAFIVGDSNTPDDENKTSMSQHIYQIRYIVHRALVEAQAQAAVQNVSLSPNIVRRWAHTLQTRRATKKIRTWQNTGNPGQPLQNDPLFHAEILAVKFLSKHNNNTRPFISMLRGISADNLLHPKHGFGSITPILPAAEASIPTTSTVPITPATRTT